MTDLLLPGQGHDDEPRPGYTVGMLTEVTQSGVVVSVSGDLDVATAPALSRRLAELLCLPLDSLTVEMSGVGFMDSSGLRALNTARTAAEERRVPFALASVSRAVRRLLDVTTASELFDIQ